MSLPPAEVSSAAHQLMQRVLDLKDARFVDGSKIASIVQTIGIQDLEARIYFLRELHEIVRKLPLKVYSDEQNRWRFITAVQDALDGAIDEEDE